MDDKLKAKILFEVSQLDKLLDSGKPLLDLCKLKSPDFIEMSAAALLLQSFYNGIENMLVLIFKHHDEKLPSGNKWHMELLERAFASSGDRKQILPCETRQTLCGCLIAWSGRWPSKTSFPPCLGITTDCLQRVHAPPFAAGGVDSAFREAGLGCGSKPASLRKRQATV